MKREKANLSYAMKKVDAFATCATRLYGVVTIRELQDIMKKWHPTSYPAIGEIKQMLKELAKDPEEVLFCLKGDKVCHFEFSTLTQKEVEEFRESVSEKPRWMPDNLLTFLDAGSLDRLLETTEALALSNFFMRHGLKEQAAEDLILVLEQMHQCDTGPAELIKRAAKKCKLKNDEDLEELASVLMNFMNNCRLRVLNGWTPTETYEREFGPVPDKRWLEQEEDPRVELYRKWREMCTSFVSKNVAPMNTVETLRAAAERIGFLEEGSSRALFDTNTQDVVVGEYAAMVDDQFGPPPIKRIIKEKDKYSGDDAKIVALYKQYRYTWLEVLAVTPGVGMKCRDLMTGKKGFLMEISMSRSAVNLVGSTICAGIGTLPNGTWIVLGVIHPANFDSPSTVLKLVLSHLNLPTKLPIQLSFADQARFVAETIRRLNVTNKFANITYGT